MGQAHVFVSYSRADSAAMERVVRDLQSAGAEVWVDVASITDGNFMQRINEGLSKCEWFVLILTPHALQSPAVRTEVETAILLQWHQKIRAVIPFLAATCNPDEVPPTWRILQYYDATRDYNAAIAGLLRAIGLSPQRAYTAPPVAPSAPIAPIAGAPFPTPPNTARLTDSPPARPEAARPQATAPALPIPMSLPESMKHLGFSMRSLGAHNVIVAPVCAIAEGPFVMGSDPTVDRYADANEQPQHSVTLAAYRISKYPLTVAEYACAVAVGAVREPLIANSVTWKDQLAHPDHPVRGILWYDALLYAHWLTSVTGESWRLPTEAEWEKAARGTDGRIFPWGNTWDAKRANTSAGRIGGTTPIGTYPSGASPYGVQDISGNVLEWCSSIMEPYPYEADARRENLSEATNKRVLRGGAWGLNESYARTAARIYMVVLDMVLGLVGVRLALSGRGHQSAPGDRMS